VTRVADLAIGVVINHRAMAVAEFVGLRPLNHWLGLISIFSEVGNTKLRVGA
jgi:hypothetical protein